jgi:DUF1680 family protein
MRVPLCLLLILISLPALSQQEPAGLALPGTAMVNDVLHLAAPSQITISGLLGDRYHLSERNRLLTINEDDLLGGFEHRPGSQAWIGEHAGKWLHAATLTWAEDKDPALKAKLDRVAAALMKTQESDGYLGTYIKSQRFGLYPGADWDVWTHKYCLIGLLTYYQYTGDRKALETCRKAANLLISTFGPGRKNILDAGTHVGMAATSVLEPIMLLYRATADHKYLDFARYIVSSWDFKDASHLLTDLLQKIPVQKIADGKAYEMTSNLVGLCELYRATGEKKYLEAVLQAWSDISQHRLYITGGGSAGECWQANYDLPNGEDAHICETCVSVTWEQLNIELLRITGDAKFADELEKTVYNHLLGAQKPTGDDWAYYTPLIGHKPYDAGMTCCHSSGPRGIALIPLFTYASNSTGVNINLFTPSKATVNVGSGKVTLAQHTLYPLNGFDRITVDRTDMHSPFAIRIRIPSWASSVRLAINGSVLKAHPESGKYCSIYRKWKAGDIISCSINIHPRLITGTHGNEGHAAIMWGPLVLAADPEDIRNPKDFDNISLDLDKSRHPIMHSLSSSASALRYENPIWSVRCLVIDITANKLQTKDLLFTPFYNAGSDGSLYDVWISLPGI